MELRLPYDLARRQVSVEIPDEKIAGVVKPRRAKTLKPETVERLVREDPYLRKLIGDVKKRRGRLSILVDDHTRPTPVKDILPVLLDMAGDEVDVRILYAKGTHDIPPRWLLERKLGGDILNDTRFIMHNAYKFEDHVFKGVTRYGTPVWINREAAEADAMIGVGSIFPSEVAGFTGGCKIVLPGISFWSSINKNHMLFISPSVEVGRLEGNVLRMDIDEAGLIAGLDAVVDFVMGVDDGILGVFVGKPVEAHRRGVKLCEKIYKASVAEKAKVVLVSPGGTEDLDLVQAFKAVFTADRVCEDGGVIVLVAACPLGTQWSELEEFMETVRVKKLDRAGILRMVVDSEVEALAGGFVYRLYHILVEGRKKLYLVSDNLSWKTAEVLGFKPFRDAQEALDEAIEEARGRVLAIPYAAYNWVEKPPGGYFLTATTSSVLLRAQP